MAKKNASNIKMAIFRMICRNDVSIMNPRLCNMHKRISKNTKYFILQG